MGYDLLENSYVSRSALKNIKVVINDLSTDNFDSLMGLIHNKMFTTKLFSKLGEVFGEYESIKKSVNLKVKNKHIEKYNNISFQEICGLFSLSQELIYRLEGNNINNLDFSRISYLWNKILQIDVSKVKVSKSYNLSNREFGNFEEWQNVFNGRTHFTCLNNNNEYYVRLFNGFEIMNQEL